MEALLIRTPVLLVALVAGGCGQDNTLATIDPKLSASPLFFDAGTVSVGATESFTIQLDSDNPLRVTNILVNNIDGEWFFYEGETAFDMGKTESREIEILYSPDDEDYHRATVEIVHDGVDGRIMVDVRGRGVVPEASLSPLGLDFGPVEVGVSGSEFVTLSNDSDVALSVTSA